MQMSIEIQEQFRGPPRSGNGGYVTGVIAGLLMEGKRAPDAAEVTLRAPVPLDRALSVNGDNACIRVMDDETLIAEALRTSLILEVPEPATFEEAQGARDASASLRVSEHRAFKGQRRVGIHPVCFCCGAELAADAGLHVYAAPIPARRQVAAAWIAPEAYSNPDGTLPEAIVCTALDCPGQFAWLAEGKRTGMLGRMTPCIKQSVRAGEQCVVIGWTMGNEGRKHFAGTALFNERRELCAYAKAVWIGRKN
ncbi:MAG: hypothetical protein OXR73_25235 [Myxococcales bacterium]|nr:hypothetical protein [Myxococcales bacterium]